MKGIRLTLIFPLFLVFITNSGKGDEYAQEKAQFQKWANKLYFAFGKRADANRDKKLSVQELRDFGATALEATDTSENDMALRIINRKNPKADSNHDGVLTKDELLAYLDRFLAEEGDLASVTR